MLNQSLRRVDGILINIHHFSLNLRRPVEVSQIVLQEWISDVYKNIKHPNKHEAIFNLDCDHSLSIHCDDYRLEVMVKQIFTNSLQFAKQADTTLQINVRITHHKGWVVMEIEDNGPGISEKDLLQLGTMFRRSSALSNGAGLGIFLCKEIAAKIGVEINWENKAEGGTRVKIEFV
jgi:K+-sensing histidine kinase KdpD